MGCAGGLEERNYESTSPHAWEGYTTASADVSSQHVGVGSHIDVKKGNSCQIHIHMPSSVAWLGELSVSLVHIPRLGGWVLSLLRGRGQRPAGPCGRLCSAPPTKWCYSSCCNQTANGPCIWHFI